MATLVSRLNDLAVAIAAALKSQRGVQAFCSGKPAAAERIGGAIAPYALTLVPARCVAIARVAATANTVFAIQVNGAAAGSITFSAGMTAGVVALTAPTIAAGALVSLIAPDTADTTLADISILLRG